MLSTETGQGKAGQGVFAETVPDRVTRLNMAHIAPTKNMYFHYLLSRCPCTFFFTFGLFDRHQHDFFVQPDGTFHHVYRSGVDFRWYFILFISTPKVAPDRHFEPDRYIGPDRLPVPVWCEFVRYLSGDSPFRCYSISAQSRSGVGRWRNCLNLNPEKRENPGQWTATSSINRTCSINAVTTFFCCAVVSATIILILYVWRVHYNS